jgi:XPB/Ssl2-like helicase family protein/WYL domain-containing protein
MSATFAEHLEGLDDEALAALLAHRRDVCVEPSPSDFARLADRLCAAGSLRDALARADSDAAEVARAVVVLEARASRKTVAAFFGAEPGHVDRAVDRLIALGMAWEDGPRLRLPDRLVEHFGAGIGGGPEIARLARVIRVEELNVLAEAHGIATTGLRKAQLVEAVTTALDDDVAVAQRIARLKPPAVHRLMELLDPDFDGHLARRDGPEKELIQHGMLVQAGHSLVVPWEIAVAAWVLFARVTGPPALPPRRADAAAAAGTAQEFLRHVGVVLDHARAAPVAALKSGGIGARERSRLVKKLGLPDDEQFVLVIDLAFATGLLAPGPDGYTTTDRYPAWRSSTAARRWADLVAAWWTMPQASAFRVEPDDTALPPPLPSRMDSSAIRQALLGAAADGGSLQAVVDEIAWFAPFFGAGPWENSAAAAALDEAVRLGLAEGDGLGPLGVALSSSDRVVETAARYLGDHDCQVLLQSDLTAVVSGVPDDEGLRLFTDAADVEARGAATVYRFSPRSVRRALDLGWTAETLLAGLERLASDVPQPLDYLVRDAARVHGSVRVHEVRTCVVAEEPLVEELAHARTLRKLGWRRVAPTVLGSAEPPPTVLSTLRDAGYSPVLDDGRGAVVVEHEPVEPAAITEPTAASGLEPAEVVRRLRKGRASADSPTLHRLAQLSGGRLSPDELDLLAHALDRRRPVHITYRVNSGSVTERTITPRSLRHRWLDSWCHLRNDEREFTVSSILAVRPA